MICSHLKRHLIGLKLTDEYIENVDGGIFEMVCIKKRVDE
jgi:hypothetical protein